MHVPSYVCSFYNYKVLMLNQYQLIALGNFHRSGNKQSKLTFKFSVFMNDTTVSVAKHAELS